MATAHRQQKADIINKLIANPQNFEFFQAMRLLLHFSKLPIDKMVQMKVSSSLQFPDSDIYSLKPAINEGHPAWEVILTFIGLTGSHGILPTHYTEMLLEQIHEKNLAVRDFFDMLQRRSLNLFYKAWERRHFYAGYEFSQNQPEQTDSFSQTLYSLSGFGIKSMRDRLIFPPEQLAFYSGFFANSIKTTAGLQSILQNFFKTPFKIKEFYGSWLDIPEENRTRLPYNYEKSGFNNKLGVDSSVGYKVWNCGHKFRVIIGPLLLEDFNRFLPDSDDYLIAKKLIHSYVGMEFDFDLQLILTKNQIKLLKLTKRAAPKLGWNSWLCSKPATQDKTDVILSS